MTEKNKVQKSTSLKKLIQKKDTRQATRAKRN